MDESGEAAADIARALPPLTPGAALAISEDIFNDATYFRLLFNPDVIDVPPSRVTMQVVGLAVLKYEYDGVATYKQNTNVCWLDGGAPVPRAGVVPYRLQLSDGQHVAPAKSFPRILVGL